MESRQGRVLTSKDAKIAILNVLKCGPTNMTHIIERVSEMHPGRWWSSEIRAYVHQLFSLKKISWHRASKWSLNIDWRDINVQEEEKS